MKKDLIILAITWTGALVMKIIFITMMITENVKVEMQYKSHRAQRARVVRMKFSRDKRVVNY